MKKILLPIALLLIICSCSKDNTTNTTTHNITTTVSYLPTQTQTYSISGGTTTYTYIRSMSYLGPELDTVKGYNPSTGATTLDIYMYTIIPFKATVVHFVNGVKDQTEEDVDSFDAKGNLIYDQVWKAGVIQSYTSTTYISN